MESIICWPTSSDHEACPGVVDIPSVSGLDKTNSTFPEGRSKSLVVNICNNG